MQGTTDANPNGRSKPSTAEGENDTVQNDLTSIKDDLVGIKNDIKLILEKLDENK